MNANTHLFGTLDILLDKINSARLRLLCLQAVFPHQQRLTGHRPTITEQNWTLYYYETYTVVMRTCVVWTHVCRHVKTMPCIYVQSTCFSQCWIFSLPNTAKRSGLPAIQHSWATGTSKKPWKRYKQHPMLKHHLPVHFKSNKMPWSFNVLSRVLDASVGKARERAKHDVVSGQLHQWPKRRICVSKYKECSTRSGNHFCGFLATLTSCPSMSSHIPTQTRLDNCSSLSFRHRFTRFQKIIPLPAPTQASSHMFTCCPHAVHQQTGETTPRKRRAMW